MKLISYLKRDGAPDIAWRRRLTPGNEKNGPGLLWLGGYASDMNGIKASFIDRWADSHRRVFTRFDYAGHGDSGGRFEDFGIGHWYGDAVAVLEELTTGPQILVGSSMGAWIACLIAKHHPDRVAGLVLIAPAADFTRDLLWPSWDRATQQAVMENGFAELPSPYDDGRQVYSRTLIEEGDRHRVLCEPLPVNAPVRILHGTADETIPWQHAKRLFDHLDTDDVILTLVKNGDHRLSAPEDLELLAETLDAF